MPAPEVAALADDPSARVMVFVDGQNLFFACQKNFGHPLCHPHLLGRHLAGVRRPDEVRVRFYTGRPSPDIAHEVERAAALDRRLAAMRRHGVTVRTRRLDYRWTWAPATPMPGPSPHEAARSVVVRPHLRAQEKGIDMLLGLEVVEFALVGAFDVGIVVSRDRDLCEIPAALRRLREKLPGPVRLEAAVVVSARLGRPITVSGFAYTHQITESVFAHVRDDTDYGKALTKPELPYRG